MTANRSRLVIRPSQGGYDVWLLTREPGKPYRVVRPLRETVVQRGELDPLGAPSCHVEKIEGLGDQRSELLLVAGFQYSLSRQMYVNRTKRSVITESFINTASDGAFKEAIVTHHGDWRFYSTEPMPEGVKRELEQLLK